MDLTTIGRWMFFAGVGLAGVGGLVWLAGKFNWPLGRLLGDLRIERGNFSFYFPIVTSLVVSLVLTILLNLLARFFRK